MKSSQGVGFQGRTLPALAIHVPLNKASQLLSADLLRAGAPRVVAVIAGCLDHTLKWVVVSCIRMIGDTVSVATHVWAARALETQGEPPTWQTNSKFRHLHSIHGTNASMSSLPQCSLELGRKLRARMAAMLLQHTVWRVRVFWCLNLSAADKVVAPCMDTCSIQEAASHD